MKSTCKYLPVLIVALFLLQGCGRGRVIPRNTMSHIYAEMFVADQWLKDHPSSRKTADTTLFYDPILKKYGYNARDYDASVRHYTKHPDRFAKLLEKSVDIIEADIDRMKGIRERQELVRKLNSFSSGYIRSDFADSTSWDGTVAYPILKTIRNNAERRDSVRADSLEASGQFAGT